MSKWLLYCLLFVLMMVWGFNVSGMKILVSYFSPAFMQAIRILMASMAVIAFLLLTKGLKKVSRKNLLRIMVTATFGVVGHHLFLAIGLTTTTATNAGLILGLVPLTTTILAMIFLGEKITIVKTLGIVFALIGVYFIVMNEHGKLNELAEGDLFLVGAVITQAISFILIKKLADTIEPKQMTGMMLLFGALLLFVPGLFFEGDVVSNLAEIPAYIWWLLLASAIIATGLGHVLYNYAIKQLGAATTSIFINLTPFFSLLGSSFFLGEIVTTKHIIGFTCILSGVILGTSTIKIRSPLRKKHYKANQVKVIGKV